MHLLVGAVLAQHGDVGVGVKVAIPLIEYGEVRQALDYGMSAGSYENRGEVLLRVHRPTSYPMAAEHARPSGHSRHRGGADMHTK
jgi:hypothetical protein